MVSLVCEERSSCSSEWINGTRYTEQEQAESAVVRSSKDWSALGKESKAGERHTSHKDS